MKIFLPPGLSLYLASFPPLSLSFFASLFLVAALLMGLVWCALVLKCRSTKRKITLRNIITICTEYGVRTFFALLPSHKSQFMAYIVSAMHRSERVHAHTHTLGVSAYLFCEQPRAHSIDFGPSQLVPSTRTTKRDDETQYINYSILIATIRTGERMRKHLKGAHTAPILEFANHN